MVVLKTKTTLLNQKEVEDRERMGIDNLPVSEAEVIAYYTISSSNVTAITQHVNNEGMLMENKCNVIFNNDNLIIADVSAEQLIEKLGGIIISL